MPRAASSPTTRAGTRYSAAPTSPPSSTWARTEHSLAPTSTPPRLGQRSAEGLSGNPPSLPLPRGAGESTGGPRRVRLRPRGPGLLTPGPRPEPLHDLSSDRQKVFPATRRLFPYHVVRRYSLSASTRTPPRPIKRSAACLPGNPPSLPLPRGPGASTRGPQPARLRPRGPGPTTRRPRPVPPLTTWVRTGYLMPQQNPSTPREAIGRRSSRQPRHRFPDHAGRGSSFVLLRTRRDRRVPSRNSAALELPRRTPSTWSQWTSVRRHNGHAFSCGRPRPSAATCS